MKVLAVIHDRDAPAGVFGHATRDAGHELEEWFPPDGHEPPALDDLGAVMVFGGVPQVDQEHEHPWLGPEKRWIREAFEGGMPVLGVCLGSQLLADAAGGRAHPAERPEIGWREVTLADGASRDPLLGILPERFRSFQWHSYTFEPPPGVPVLARTPQTAQAFRAGERAWGVQFHAEVTAATLEAWLRDGADGEDARSIGLDAVAVQRQSQDLIGDWNELGRQLSSRFLQLAAS
ncbi:MAG TPA: type 1 glutamine amidotransferase [Thermoleophilaceae bacterium]